MSMVEEVAGITIGEGMVNGGDDDPLASESSPVGIMWTLEPTM